MDKLMLKKELYWKLQPNGVSVFTNNSDLQRRIHTDKPQRLFSVLQALKYPTSLASLHRSLPSLSTKFIDDVIAFLKNKHYLYVNANVEDKYSRLQSFASTIPNTEFSDYAGQLAKTRVLILGVGTGGSFQLEVLKRIGIRNFTILDKDKVEAKNLGAQNYKETDVGKYKVDVLKRELSDSTTTIHVLKTYISSYEDLANKVSLSSYDYVVDTMDDKAVNLEILSRLFLENPKIKLIINGYLVLKQMSYIVDQHNYIQVLKQVRQLFKTVKPDLELTTNSGSIFNALFMSLSVGKMIFDDVFQVRTTNYAYADFFMNDYFIGNWWERNLFSSFSKQKKALNSQAFPVTNITNRWIDQISHKNYLKNRVMNPPDLSEIEEDYLHRKSSFRNLLKAKNMYMSSKYLKEKESVNLTAIKPQLLAFIDSNFGTKAHEIVANFDRKHKVYTNRQRFDKEANLALFNSGESVIYSTENTFSTRKTNTLIHELLHSILFSQTFNSYKHEDFVLNYHTNFLLSNKQSPMFRSLMIAHLRTTLNLYMNMFASVQYEKELLNGNLRNFTKLPVLSTVSEDEMLRILNMDLSPDHPFHGLKYVLAVDNHFSLLEEVFEYLTGGTAYEKLHASV